MAVRRPDPIALQRLEALSAAVGPAWPPGAGRPVELGWPAEPWDLDAWPDVPPSIDAWPVRSSPAPAAVPPGEAPPHAEPSPTAGPAVPDLEPAPSWAAPPGLVEHARAALLARLPAPLRSGRFDPGRRGAYVIGMLGLLAAVAAIAFAVHGRAEAVTSSGPVAGSTARVVGATAGAAGPDPISGGVTVEVDVEGRVRRPGLAMLPSGARVADALKQAGGALPGTDTRTLDLAAPVTDGQQLVVGLVAAPAAAAAGTAARAGLAGAAGAVGAAGAPAATGTAGTTAPIDLNSATADQLDALPHVGPATAAKIVAWRTAHGPFAAVTDLQQVPGIGPSTYQDIAPLVMV